MDAMAKALGAVEVLDEAGKPLQVASLWAERPVVLLFVRHFG